MADRLPDEIISEILAPALQVPDHKFSDTSSKSPFASSSGASSSSTLLVCKSWLRVATPLIYYVVVIRTKAQAQALQTTLKDNANLGQFVKKLRVEGGFGRFTGDILKKTPNVRDIAISLFLAAADLTSGLVAGLPSINPTRLIVIDQTRGFHMNKAVTAVMKTLETCAKKWNNINTIIFPYDRSVYERYEFIRTLCTCPTLENVSFPLNETHSVDYLAQFAKNPSLKAIEIRTKSSHDQIAPPTSTNPRLSQLLRWTDLPKKPSTPIATRSCRPTNPSFRPMESVPQHTVDCIWNRILSFAMLSLEQYPRSTAPWKAPNQKINSERLQFLLVSKLFQRLAISFLYSCPAFNKSNFSSFSHKLAALPTLARHVRELDVRLSDQRDDLFTSIGWRVPLLDIGTLASIIPYTHNLTHLIAGGKESMSWSVFTTLAETAGGTLEEFIGFSLVISDDTTVHSPAVFGHFTALRSLAWKCGYKPPLFGAVDTKSAAALPALEFLSIKNFDMSVFSQMQLPSLRHLAIQTRGKGASMLMSTHGSKIQHLEVEHATIDAASDLSGRDLEDGFKHASLQTIILTNFVMMGLQGQKENDKHWAAFFRALVKSQHLPVLREIRIRTFEWPTIEREILKCPWVEWAEMMLERGIKMTDRAGTEWRPKLKASRR
ncbi:hypothetical protein B0H17DRAFT_1202550 [Mycena rosella]|uniref:F-box domain-containing protein n=1 Tax=Mycena rosella TaxID=1033263 RepID=A0AAD7GI96_MYCRO|nr:hypothetical protein B0H17DRAFT_1202550 [Mycena rosella]